MALIYIKSGSLWFPILCHVLNNTIVFMVSFIGSDEINTVVQLQSDYWMGLIFLLVALPLIAYYIHLNWPQKDSKSPYYLN